MHFLNSFHAFVIETHLLPPLSIDEMLAMWLLPWKAIDPDHIMWLAFVTSDTFFFPLERISYCPRVNSFISIRHNFWKPKIKTNLLKPLFTLYLYKKGHRYLLPKLSEKMGKYPWAEFRSCYCNWFLTTQDHLLNLSKLQVLHHKFVIFLSLLLFFLLFFLPPFFPLSVF